MDAVEILNQLRRDKSIEGQTFGESLDLNFHGLSVSDKKIEFIDCNFKGKVTFINFENRKSIISFKNCQFDAGFVFTQSKCFILNVYDCKIEEFLILNSVFDDFITIRSNFLTSFRIEKCEGDYFEISESEILRLLISAPEVKQANIFSNNSIGYVYLSGLVNAYFHGGFEKINFDLRQFEFVEFDSLENNSVDTIGEFDLSHETIHGNLSFRKLHFNLFKLSNISNTGGIKLNEISIDKARFLDSSIVSFDWNQVHFKKELEIERCDLSTLRLTNVKWLSGKKLSNSFLDCKIPLFYGLRRSKLEKKEQAYDASALINLQYERDTYRQLKAASIANHNDIESLDFYRNEMRLYWKEIRINGDINWQNRIIVFINRWVSDFGQSWALPLLWLGIIHSILYFCIIGFNFSSSFEDFRNGMGQYLELLNPVHKTPDYIQGFDIGLELLLRILDAFFIYHFVRAIRKYAKV